jgi:hypothetical protein
MYCSSECRMSGSTIVSTFTDLNTAILTADSLTSGSYTITLRGEITETTADLEAINLKSGVSLVIQGGTLNGGNTYEGLFVYQGNLTVQNLTIEDTLAKGGNGGAGNFPGGGGAGLGGGLFIAGPTQGAGGGNVTLAGVSFLDDSAVGGNGGARDYYGGNGGGGGLGGNGGNGATYASGGGGGGGVGKGASGGSGSGGAGGTGIIPGAASGAAGSLGAGGASGGGGGGGAQYYGYDGGGGVGAAGPTGGFGGGGVNHAQGGFGGGGGGYNPGGVVGAGASNGSGSGGGGGFGAGSGNGSGSSGGGGLGAGGDIFVQAGGSLIIESGTLGLGTVAGGTGANDGAGLGTAIFLQGTQSQTLAPANGQTLTIAGSIDDESGSNTTSGQGGGSGAAGLILNGDGTVILTAASDYTGGTTIDSGALILDAPGATGTGGITFGSGDPPSLTFSTANAPTTAITGFVYPDVIDITDLPISGTSTFYVNNAGILALPDTLASGGTLDLTFNGIGTTTPFIFSSNGAGGADLAIPCFASGTRILREDGDVLVEDIQVGDTLITVRENGSVTQKVIWTGKRAIDIRRHPAPNRVRPIRILAGAIAENIPERDLRLSPEHAVYLNGALFTAESLINGTTIFQEQTTTHVTYHHIELESHDIIMAEGLPCESFLDTGNKTMFESVSGITTLHPDFRPGAGAEFCAPLIRDGEALDRIRTTLTSRATQTRTAA